MQFIYLLFGGLIVYICYQFFYLNARLIFFIIAMPVALLSLGLAFVKVYDQPLGTFIKHAIQFSLTPKRRVWHKEETLEGESVVSGATVKKPVSPPPQKRLSSVELEKLLEILDTTGRPAQNGLPQQSISNQRRLPPDGQTTKTG